MTSWLPVLISRFRQIPLADLFLFPLHALLGDYDNPPRSQAIRTGDVPTLRITVDDVQLPPDGNPSAQAGLIVLVNDKLVPSLPRAIVAASPAQASAQLLAMSPTVATSYSNTLNTPNTYHHTLSASPSGSQTKVARARPGLDGSTSYPCTPFNEEEPERDVTERLQDRIQPGTNSPPESEYTSAALQTSEAQQLPADPHETQFCCSQHPTFEHGLNHTLPSPANDSTSVERRPIDLHPESEDHHDQSKTSTEVADKIPTVGASTHNEHSPGPPSEGLSGISIAAIAPSYNSKLASTPAVAECPSKKALLVGIVYRHENGYEELEGSVKDVSRMRDFLIDRCGFLPQNITTLTDEVGASKERLPSKENILRALNDLVRNAKPFDTLFFLFAGHGWQVKNHNGQEDDGMDEVLLTLGYRIYDNGGVKNFIKDDELHVLATALPAKCRFIALFDCCHSGTALDLDHIITVDFEPEASNENNPGISNNSEHQMHSTDESPPFPRSAPRSHRGIICSSPGFLGLPYAKTGAIIAPSQGSPDDTDDQSCGTDQEPANFPDVYIVHTRAVYAAAMAFMKPLKRRVMMDDQMLSERKPVEAELIGKEVPDGIDGETLELLPLGSNYFDDEGETIVKKDPSELPIIMSWSACSDDRKTFENGRGEGVLVNAFIDSLSSNPQPSIRELLKDLTRASYRENKHRDRGHWPQPQFGSLCKIDDDELFYL